MAIKDGQAYKVSMRTPRLPVIFCLSAAVVACGRSESPEAQVRAVIERMETAAEARDVGDLLEHLSTDYRDAYGQGAEDATRYARGFFLANQRIHLLTRIDELTFPNPGEARAKVLVGMVGRETAANDDWNLAADLYEFDVALIREADEWKVTYAEWTRR